MKTLKNLGKALSKIEQQQVNGGARCRYGDAICCGSANWQCGSGPASGGYYNPSNGTCDCA